MVNQQKLTYPWAVQRYQRRYVDPRRAVDIPGERYDGRLVTNVNLADANASRRRIYFFGFATGDVSYRERYWRVPHGLVSALVPKRTALDLDAIERDNLAILESFDWPAILTTPGDAYFLDEVRNAHAKAWCDLAIFFHSGPNEAGAPVDFARAERLYKRTLQLFPDHLNAVLGYGLLLSEKLGRPAEGNPLLVRYLQARPEDPRAAQIAKLAGVPAPAPK
jgi:hypothetical protein